MSKTDFKDSTIDACMWLIVFRPADLAEFLRAHPPGKVLERIARQRIADNAERRKRDQA